MNTLSELRVEIEKEYLVYDIAFQLWCLATGAPYSDEIVQHLAGRSLYELGRHGREKTLEKVLGKRK